MEAKLIKKSNSAVSSLVSELTNVTDACAHDRCRFQSKTRRGNKNMDCIDIFKHRSDPDYFYGVYHVMDPSISNFVSYLA